MDDLYSKYNITRDELGGRRLDEILTEELPGEADEYSELGYSLPSPEPRDFPVQDPIEVVIELMDEGDVLVAGGVDDPSPHRIALKYVMDPRIQLELGCLFVQRAGFQERPLCEHLYEDKEFEYWNPATFLHKELAPRSELQQPDLFTPLALRAYANAWAFWSRYNICSFFDIESLVRVVALELIALDGMRVCYEALRDTTRLWLLCRGIRGYLEWHPACRAARDETRDLDELLAEIRARFARSEGRLEPLMAGRPKVLVELEKELAWWDLLPQSVKDYLADAEYQRSNLRDPTYNPKATVTTYSIVVEEMLRRRLGHPIDLFLKMAGDSEANSFRDRFLRRKAVIHGKEVVRERRCADLILSEFGRHLSTPEFRRYLSKIGADTKFCIEELPGLLKKVADYRNAASHADRRVFTSEEILEVRDIVLRVVGELAGLRITFQSPP